VAPSGAVERFGWRLEQLGRITKLVRTHKRRAAGILRVRQLVGLDIKKGQQDTDRLDHVSVALSVLLFVSPWLLGYADQTLAATTAWVSAVFIAATSLAACIRFAKW
jgi:hypothetical protein